MERMSSGDATVNKRKKVRGTVRNLDRLQAFTEDGSSGSASWADCDPKRLQDVVATVTSMGGAVILGLSRDLGAHSLTLLLDDKRKTLWFNGGADLDDELKTVLGVLGGMSE